MKIVFGYGCDINMICLFRSKSVKKLNRFQMRPDQVQAISVQAGALDVGEAMHFWTGKFYTLRTLLENQ